MTRRMDAPTGAGPTHRPAASPADEIPTDSSVPVVDVRRMAAEYAAAAEKSLGIDPFTAIDIPARPDAAQVLATLAVASVLADVRGQLASIAELLAAHPGISHVMAARQVIDEMREELERRGDAESDVTEADRAWLQSVLQN